MKKKTKKKGLEFNMTSKGIFSIVATAFIILIGLIIGITGYQTVDDSEIVVYQSYSGDKEVWFEPGLKFVLFGKTTVYQKSDEFYFLEKDGPGKDNEDQVDLSQCIRTRFNDQGAAHICGQVTFRLPRDEKQMLKLHSEYRGMEGIKDRMIKTTLTKAIYNSGPLMSSRESAGSRRSQLSEYIDEQAKMGIYKTVQTKAQIDDFTSPPIKTTEMVPVPVKEEDGTIKLDDNGKPIMKEQAQEVLKPRTKTVEILEPKKEGGKLVFQEQAIAAAFGVLLNNITVKRVFYERKVKEQIDRQRDLEMQVQTKISESEKAKQEAVTAEENGKANAAKARWEQEVKKAQALTAAQQRKEVAEEDLKAAELERKAQVERAKGEAEAKELVMKADGALDKKLKAYVEVQKAFAAEIGKQRWVPEVVMGSSGSQNSAADLMQMWQVKAARDLNLDNRVR